MGKGITHVGLDVHKQAIYVAMLLPRRKKAVEWKLANEKRAVRRLLRKLEREAPGRVECCYEAGPCGYALMRDIDKIGKQTTCVVVAPGLIPVKPGEKIKTDRRDARKLAELLRAGLLTEVHPPAPEEESVRDLCRCREDAKEDLMRARHRLGKMLLRRGLTYGGKAWTQRHRQWLRSIAFDHEADQAVLGDYLRAIELVEERKAALEQKLGELSEKDPYKERVGWLRCFRGIDTVTAMTIVAELHDFSRFRSPRALMAYLGLVPGEHSSGDRSQRTGITKTGNKHVRRILIETAWHYRHNPAVGVKLRRRREGQPGHVIAIADRAQLRLHRKLWRMTMRGKIPNKAVTAVARELVGFLWAVLYPEAATGTMNVRCGRREAP